MVKNGYELEQTCRFCGFWIAHTLTLRVFPKEMRNSLTFQRKRQRCEISAVCKNRCVLDWRMHGGDECFRWIIPYVGNKLTSLLEERCEPRHPAPNNARQRREEWTRQWSLSWVSLGRSTLHVPIPCFKSSLLEWYTHEIDNAIPIIGQLCMHEVQITMHLRLANDHHSWSTKMELKDVWCWKSFRIRSLLSRTFVKLMMGPRGEGKLC